MQIREFLDFTKRHRLSIEQFYMPPSTLEDWKHLTNEALWRNNSKLMDEIYTKCPDEFRKKIELVIKETLHFKSNIKPLSQTMLEWIFTKVAKTEEVTSSHIAFSERNDLLDYFLSKNKNHQYDEFLYTVCSGLANQGKIDIFKKIASKIPLCELQAARNKKEKVYFSDNIFVRLFSRNPEQKTYEYICEQISLTKDDYFDIIKACSNYNLDDIKNKQSCLLLEYILSDLKERNNNLYAEITTFHPSHRYKLPDAASIEQCKILLAHGVIDPHIVFCSLHKITREKDESYLYSSLKYFYENFSNDEINKTFEDKSQTDFLKSLIYLKLTNPAKLMIAHHKELYNESFKKQMTDACLHIDADIGIEWAKHFLEESEIDELLIKYKALDGPSNCDYVERLTSWKCEQFLFSQKNKDKISSEKKKIKI